MICAANPAYPHSRGSDSAGDDFIDCISLKNCITFVISVGDDQGHWQFWWSTIMSWSWSWCWQPSRRVAVEPRDYERNLRKTLKILSSSLPKTFVVLLAPIQVRDALQNHHIFAHNDFMIKLWMMTTPLTRSASPWIWWTRGNFARNSPTLMSVPASLDQDLALLAGDRLCHVDDDDYNRSWNCWYI